MRIPRKTHKHVGNTEKGDGANENRHDATLPLLPHSFKRDPSRRPLDTAPKNFSTSRQLVRIVREIISHGSRKRLRKIAHLLLTNAGNSTELRPRRRISARHFAQRNIGENDVGGHIAFISEFATQNAQLFEERFVAFDFADTTFRSFLLLNIVWSGQRDLSSLSQCGPTGAGQFERRESSLRRCHESKSQ